VGGHAEAVRMMLTIFTSTCLGLPAGYTRQARRFLMIDKQVLREWVMEFLIEDVLLLENGLRSHVLYDPWSHCASCRLDDCYQSTRKSWFDPSFWFWRIGSLHKDSFGPRLKIQFPTYNLHSCSDRHVLLRRWARRDSYCIISAYATPDAFHI
jgi:hypothetical protein